MPDESSAKRWVTAALVSILIAGILAGATACDQEPEPTALPVSAGTLATIPPGATMARVVRIVDGDTVIVRIDGREERLRYIGIDTPESVDPNSPVECYGNDASAANGRLVGDRTVYLVRDVSDRDRYGRLLRYVYIREPGTDRFRFVNRELVASGYATAARYPPDTRYSEQFSRAEEQAREAGAGLWSVCR